jgi:hypothetical protein
MGMRVLLAWSLFLVPGPAAAAIIQVTPSDNWTKIEGAKAGDIVEIAPGTYKFRVMLSQQGTATAPIIIRAKDPANRPVWDLAGQPVSAWPGSYTAGDKGRGCWQVSGSHYQISGIVFKNCQDSASAGLRAIDCGPLTVRDCLFVGNTNGLTGSSENLVVEFSEFHDNGKLVATGNMTHNIYIYGGVFTLRYSYVHDSHEGQNFHIRARESVLEYNWLARPDGYSGDIMSCNTLCGSTGTNPVTQKMLLRGNVLIQGTPKNLSQIIALFNDEPGGSYDSTGESAAMELTMIGNTVIGNQTDPSHRLVNLRNDSGVSTKVHLSNNIFVKLGTLYEVADPAASNWSVDGQNNWVATGIGGTGNLTGTISGTDPGFVNAAGKDYTLTATSPCLGKAAALAGVPVKEYYLNEIVKLQYRLRSTAKDIGAFERGNSSPAIGPYGTPPLPPDAGLLKDAGPTSDTKPWPKTDAKIVPGPDGQASKGDGGPLTRDGPQSEAGQAADANPAASDVPGRSEAGADRLFGEGCDCELAGAASGNFLVLLLGAAGLGLAARRRPRSP